ncbi:MAG: hypothetical protein ABI051_00200 [Vicinamibacterales bacterium]
MNADTIRTDVRQFYWGLSNGIAVLAVAGAFWLWIGATALSTEWRPLDKYPVLIDSRQVLGWAAGIAMLALIIITGAIRVRRKALGFSVRDLRRPELADTVRVIRHRFRWVSLAQAAGSGLSIWLGLRLHREDLIWPGIGLVVSLHFLPLGQLFRMRPYILAAVAGSMVSGAALLLPTTILPPSLRFLLIGVGMGLVVWVTAAYAILHADELALRCVPGADQQSQ